MSKPRVSIQPYMLRSHYAFISQVRAQMRFHEIPPEQIWQFEVAAMHEEGSPILEALKYVELECRP